MSHNKSEIFYSNYFVNWIKVNYTKLNYLFNFLLTILVKSKVIFDKNDKHTQIINTLTIKFFAYVRVSKNDYSKS